MPNIFSRFRDIISANINSMLDRAEDPEKLIKLMITEMEDTLVEIKAACAGAMAEKKRLERAVQEARERADGWAERAELAVNKGREDLAREALVEKRNLIERSEGLAEEAAQSSALVEQYQDEIRQLEEKLATAEEKRRMLVQRHIHAQGKKKAQAEIRKFTSTESIIRFEQFENRIERLEAEADLVNYGRKDARPTLDEEFEALAGDDEIERELRELKAKSSGASAPADQA
jgi:phage shock protein A